MSIFIPLLWMVDHLFNRSNKGKIVEKGMVKWGGFYLTEHTKAIDGERTIERSKPIQKFQMDVNEIAETLNQATLKNKSVTI